MNAFVRMLVAVIWCCSLPVQPFAPRGNPSKALVWRRATLAPAKMGSQAIPFYNEVPQSAFDRSHRRYRMLDGQRPLHTRVLFWLQDTRAISERRLGIILRGVTGAVERSARTDTDVSDTATPAATPATRGWSAVARWFVDLWKALKRLFGRERAVTPIPEESQPRSQREKPQLALSSANFLPAAYFAKAANSSGSLLPMPLQFGKKSRIRSSNTTSDLSERRYDAVQYLLQRYNLSATPAAPLRADNASATLNGDAEGRSTRWRSAASFAGRVASNAAAYVSAFNRQQYGREYALNVLREIHALRRGRQETAAAPAASSTTANADLSAANATHVDAPTLAAANDTAAAATLVDSPVAAEADALVAHLQASRGQALLPLSSTDNHTQQAFTTPMPSQWWRLSERRLNESEPSTLLLRFGAAPTAAVLTRAGEMAQSSTDVAEQVRGTWRSLTVDRDVVGLEFTLQRDGHPLLRYRGAAVGGRVLGSIFADNAAAEQCLGAFQLSMAIDDTTRDAGDL